MEALGGQKAGVCVLAQWTHPEVRARAGAGEAGLGVFLLSTHQPRFYLLSFSLNVSSLGEKKLVSFDTELLMQDTESVTEGEITAKITGSSGTVSSYLVTNRSQLANQVPAQLRETDHLSASGWRWAAQHLFDRN